MAKTKSSDKIVSMNRREKSGDRRATERRKNEAPVAVERRQLERREKTTRRRQIDPTTCERDYSVEEIEFMNALDQYKRTSGRMFPTCSEILEVIRSLGYTKNSIGGSTMPMEVPAPYAPPAFLGRETND